MTLTCSGWSPLLLWRDGDQERPLWRIEGRHTFTMLAYSPSLPPSPPSFLHVRHGFCIVIIAPNLSLQVRTPGKDKVVCLAAFAGIYSVTLSRVWRLAGVTLESVCSPRDMRGKQCYSSLKCLKGEVYLLRLKFICQKYLKGEFHL